MRLSSPELELRYQLSSRGRGAGGGISEPTGRVSFLTAGSRVG